MRGLAFLSLVLAGAALASAQGTAVVDTPSGLRLRSGKGTNSSVRGSYPRGTKVEVLSVSGSWAKVRIRGRTGYMYNRFLKHGKKPRATPAETPAETQPRSAERGDYMIRARRGLRMRTRPTIKSRVVATIPDRARVKVLDKQHHPWWKCTARGKTGYMWNGYLKKLGFTQDGADPTRTGNTGRGTGNTGGTGSNAGSNSGSSTGSAGNNTGGNTGSAGNPNSGGIVNTGNLSGLRPGFRAKVERILRRLQSLGWQPRVAEGRRSVAQQREKVRKGYSKTMNSYHLYGNAADIIDRRWGWKIPQSHRFWRDLGRAAAAEGLTWGGNWRSFKDVAHVQARSRNAN